MNAPVGNSSSVGGSHHCEECGYSAGTKYGLTMHMKVAHRNSAKNFR